MDDVGPLWEHGGSNFTAENSTKLDNQAWATFAWVVMSLFILLNLVVIGFLLCSKTSESQN